MKLTPSQIAEFKDKGFLVFPDLFSAEEVAILKGEVPALYAERRPENVRERTGDVVRTNFAAHTYNPRRSGVLDHGAYYAPKSFETPDGRRVLWGWIRETRPEAEFAAAGWSGCMSLPRVLSIGEQGQLEMHPAPEVLKLRGTGEPQRPQAGGGAVAMMPKNGSSAISVPHGMMQTLRS